MASSRLRQGEAEGVLVDLNMRTLLGLLMISNATLFLFGAIQQAGLGIGPFLLVGRCISGRRRENPH
jgi:hypothetical protein